MASNDACESCFSKDKHAVAVKLCTDCDEKLCKECGVNHLGFKAFKSHHLAQLASIPTSIPTFEKYCSFHENMNLDFYCTYHDTTCCRECIPTSHQTCPKIMSLEAASTDVQNSPLLIETLNEMNNINETLQTLSKFIEDSISSLDSSVTSILGEISSNKKRLVKQLDEMEHKLKGEISTRKEKLKIELKKKENVISHKMGEIEETRQEIEFLKKNCMNKKLFLALQGYAKEIKSSEAEVIDIITTCIVTDIHYEERALHKESLGQITETTRQCDVQYSPIKHKQAQSLAVVTHKSSTKFKHDSDIIMEPKGNYHLTGIAVTKDNKILLCNFHSGYKRVFVYTDCNRFEDQLFLSSEPFSIAVITDSSHAFVTLPEENSIQLIDTDTLAMEGKIRLRFQPWGVTATTDIICIAGESKVCVLDTKGTCHKKIEFSGIGLIFFISFNHQNNTILFSGDNGLHCIDFDGNILYENPISGIQGVAIDKQGDVYAGDYATDSVQRLSPKGQFKDTVLTNKDGIRNPYAMAFNNDYKRLFIICNDNTTVACFACAENED